MGIENTEEQRREDGRNHIKSEEGGRSDGLLENRAHQPEKNHVTNKMHDASMEKRIGKEADWAVSVCGITEPVDDGPVLDTFITISFLPPLPVIGLGGKMNQASCKPQLELIIGKHSRQQPPPCSAIHWGAGRNSVAFPLQETQIGMVFDFHQPGDVIIVPSLLPEGAVAGLNKKEYERIHQDEGDTEVRNPLVVLIEYREYEHAENQKGRRAGFELRACERASPTARRPWNSQVCEI